MIDSNPKVLEKKIENLKMIQYKYTWEEISKNLELIYNGGNNE